MNEKDIFPIVFDECKEHSFTDLCRIFNGRSCYGTKICQKCGI